MITFSPLDKTLYAGKKFEIRYTAHGYYDIQKTADGFSFSYQPFEKSKEMGFEDSLFGDWLEAPVAYGAFEDDALIGFAEGSPESWNNRWRISNIAVFQPHRRHLGIGTRLINMMLDTAQKSGARMAVLETQSCNERAISFYKKHGFEIIGLDLYAYTNTDPDRHEIRIEMGRIL